jgi:hypothetical protein
MGKSVRNHPVMKQMLKLRYAMEKMHSLDNKLKYQIDRLVKLSEGNLSKEEIKTGLLRPNLASFLSNLGEEDVDGGKSSKNKTKQIKSSKNQTVESDEDEEEEKDEMDVESEYDEEDFDGKNKSGVYRPPKMSSTPYPVSDKRNMSLCMS